MKIRNAFGLFFALFIALPILIIFWLSTFISLGNARDNSIDLIRTFHNSIIASIEAEKQNASQRLSHLMYANGSEILSIARECDTLDPIERYQSIQRLNAALDYALPPVSEILSVRFEFASGNYAEYKMEMNFSIDEEFRQILSEDRGNVHILALGASEYPSLYMGTADGNMILVAGIAPGSIIDKSGEVSYVTLFQTSAVYKMILSSDSAYSVGRNGHGLTAILSLDGQVLSSARMEREDIDCFLSGRERNGYTYVSTPVGDEYIVLSVISGQDLMRGYGPILLLLALAVLVVFTSFIIFLHLLLANIINPVEEVSGGLKAVEAGDLAMHIDAKGVLEVRTTIHSFNAMVRRIRSLIKDYEEQIVQHESSPERLFALYVSGKGSEKEKSFFERSYLSVPHRLIVLYAVKGAIQDCASIARQFDTDPEFSACCLMAPVDEHCSLILYRVTETEAPVEMMGRILRHARVLFDCGASAVVSGTFDTPQQAAAVTGRLLTAAAVLPLYAIDSVYMLDELIGLAEDVVVRAGRYKHFSDVLRSTDLKAVNEEREILLSGLAAMDVENARKEALSLILSFISSWRLAEIESEKILGIGHDFISKMMALEDTRAVMLFVSNFITRAVEGVRRQLNEDELSAVVRAKRYIADNYQSAELSLSSVAAYVNLNERYLSTMFAKEAGETFINYLTAIRMQNAASLLRQTSYKVYEVAMMCGYQNPEHFNKTFSKYHGISPSKYRKMNNSQ